MSELSFFRNDFEDVQEYFPSELNASVVEPLRYIINALKERGASVVSVSLPSTPYALSAYYVIASAEASSNLARYDGIEYGAHANVHNTCLSC